MTAVSKNEKKIHKYVTDLVALGVKIKYNKTEKS
jgi:hypothetical protein